MSPDLFPPFYSRTLGSVPTAGSRRRRREVHSRRGLDRLLEEFVWNRTGPRSGLHATGRDGSTQSVAQRECVFVCVCVCEQRGGGQMMSATQMVTMSPLGKIPGATATGAA